MCNFWLFCEVYVTCLISLHYLYRSCIMYVFMYMWQKLYWHFAAVFCWAAGSSVDVQWQTKVTAVSFLLFLCERSINSLRKCDRQLCMSPKNVILCCISYTFCITEQAVDGMHCIYTDVWTPNELSPAGVDVLMGIQVSWDIMKCQLVYIFWYFKGR